MRLPSRHATGQALLVLHLALSPVAFSYTTAELFEYPKLALLLLTALLLLALGASWGVDVLVARGRAPGERQAPAPGWRSREPVALGFLLLLGSALASTLASLSPWTSLIGTAESPAGLPVLLAGAVLFFATRALCSTPTHARRLLTAPVLAAAVAATYATLQWLGWDPIPWVRTATFGGAVRPFSTLSHPNFLGAYLAMAFPLVATFAWRAAARRQWPTAAAFTLLGLLSLLSIATSLSRGAWLALAAALLVLLSGACLLGQRRVALTLGLGLPLAAGLTAALWLGLQEPGGFASLLVERARQLTESSGRLHIWRAAWHIFLEHPLLGCGLDAFALAFQHHRAPEYWLLEWDTTPYKAHDEFLHVLATQGLVGAGAALVMTGGLVTASRRAWRRASSEERPLLLALFAGLAAFYVQGLFSFTVAATGTLFVTFAGVLSRLGAGAPPDDSSSLGSGTLSLGLGGAGVLSLLVFLHDFHGGAPSQAGGGVALLVLATVIAGTVSCLLWSERHEPVPPVLRAPRTWRPRAWRLGLHLALWGAAVALAQVSVVRPILANQASREGERLVGGQPARAVAHFERAVALDPTRPLSLMKLGMALQLSARSVEHPEERSRLLSQAREAFQRALALVPEDARLHAGLGTVLAELALLGKAPPAQALAEHDAALARDPHNANLSVQAAGSALMLGDLSAAQRYATRAAGLYPHFGPPRAQWGYVALVQGYPETAVQLLREALDGEWYGDENGRLVASTNLAAALLALGRRQEAIAQYQHLLAEQPDYPPALQALRELGAAPGTPP